MLSSVQSCIKNFLNWFWAQFIFNLKYELHCYSDILIIGPVPFLHCTTSVAKPQQNKAPSVCQFSCSVVSDSATPWTAAHQASLSITLPELTRTHVHQVGDVIQPSHPLSSPSPPAFSLSQHQGLFQWVGSSHQVAKGLQCQFPHQCFQWIIRTDFLYDGLVWSPCSPRDSQESSPKPQFRSINSLVLTFLYPTLTSIHDYRKNHSFD